EARILELGPETVMAFLAETVVGATTGATPPAPGYFRRIRELCDRYGVLLILDEVMCGAGRTGTFLACEQEGVTPDIVVIAKGLGAGYQPIGAVMCSAEVYAAFDQGSGAFQHGHTYSGHPIACAAALAVQDVIREEGLLERVRSAGQRLGAALRAEFGQHPHVGDIRGRGLLQAIELVSDRAEKTPFTPEKRLAATVKAQAFERGLMVYPGSGTVDGVRGDHLLLAPPYTVTDAQIDDIVQRLSQALDASLASGPAA
ncbi:MAG: aminotransferase class III-fold pyridoxal phosphate-dependent enzyme, partial [Candidatus Levyibacteriota bacterium]